MERLLIQSEQEPLNRIALTQMAALYSGDLLPECYDDWIVPMRRQYKLRVQGALEQLIALLENARAYEDAIRYAHSLLETDPLREVTYQHLMRLRALQGDRSGALGVFQDCVNMLRNELAVEPGPKTERIYHRILNYTIGGSDTHPSFAVAKDATELVGRETEWLALRSAWQQVVQGAAGMVSISGVAGIGKTRLAEECLLWASRQGILTARARSHAAQGAIAYAPVAELLRNQGLRTRLEKLDDLWHVEVTRLLPELHELRPDLPPPEPVQEQWQRRRFFEALLADEQPILVLFDDLQWSDSETLDWLHYTISSNPQARLLVVVTVRDDEIGGSHPYNSLRLALTQNDQLTEIRLDPLCTQESKSLAAQIATGNLTEAHMEQICHDAAGNPLFLVEIVRAGLQEHSDPAIHSTTSGLPPKAFSAIQWRLSQLSGEAQDIVSLAAVIGRSFRYDILLRAGSHDEDALVDGLDELWQRRILLERDDGYDFSHHRLRDVAYSQLSAARRRLLHERVAIALEQIHASDLDAVSSQLAEHFELASCPDKALQYHLRAGKAALYLYAHEMALRHFQRGLTLIAGEPRRRQERILSAVLLDVLGDIQGGIPVYLKTLTRALKPVELVDEAAQKGQILVWLGWFYRRRAAFYEAREVDERLLRNADETADQVAQLDACHALGVDLFYLGEFSQSRRYFERGSEINRKRDRLPFEAWKHSFGMSLETYYSRLLWLLGYPDQAREKMSQSLLLARQLYHAPSFALSAVARLQKNLRDHDQTLLLAKELIDQAQKDGLPERAAYGAFLQGWAKAQQGQHDEAISLMREGLSGWSAAGIEVHRPDMLATLAEVHLMRHEEIRALSLLSEAKTLVEDRGENIFKAEIYRLEGMALMALDPSSTAEAEDALVTALTVSRRQQARSFELRAATSLARLWHSRGETVEAAELLAPIVNWFSEGFDTRDLIEARQLLDTLTSGEKKHETDVRMRP